VGGWHSIDWQTAHENVRRLEERLTWHERLGQALDSTREIVGKVWLYVVIGIAIGAGIHGFVPDDFLADALGKDTFWAVPAAVILGVPLYSNAAGVIPWSASC
jgi:hypothetical protein